MFYLIDPINCCIQKRKMATSSEYHRTSEAYITAQHRKENELFFEEIRAPTYAAEITNTEEGLRFLIHITDLHLQRLEEQPETLTTNHKEDTLSVIRNCASKIENLIFEDYDHRKLSAATYSYTIPTITNYISVLQEIYMTYEESRKEEFIAKMTNINTDFRSIHYLIASELMIRSLVADTMYVPQTPEMEMDTTM